MTDTPNEVRPDVTRLLEQAAGGDGQAAAQILPLVYAELRELARRRMAAQPPDHTLQATALVHEAYLKLVGGRDVRWADRSHFFFAAAEAMRQILIDGARGRGRLKRGGGRTRSPLSVADLAAEQDGDQILAVDEALCRLEAQWPDVAAVVRLRFFAGLSVEETAGALDVSERTVHRQWTYGRAWLARELGPGS